MNNVIQLSYEGSPVRLRADGWVNATDAAARFGKAPNEWLRLSSTREYLEKLAIRMVESNAGKSRITLLTTRRGNSAGSGTWLHPKLAVKFACWLSVDFEIWANEQIDSLLRGTQPAMETFNRACKRYDDDEAVASEHGRGLARWKRQKPLLLSEVERGRNLLQMTLGLNQPEQPRLRVLP